MCIWIWEFAIIGAPRDCRDQEELIYKLALSFDPKNHGYAPDEEACMVVCLHHGSTTAFSAKSLPMLAQRTGQAVRISTTPITSDTALIKRSETYHVTLHTEFNKKSSCAC